MIEPWTLVCFVAIWWKGRKSLGDRGGKKRILGPTGGGRLWEGNPAGVISWPWQTWLNFVVGWPVSQIPFLPLRRKDTISYLLASESVRATENSHLVWHTHTYPLYLYLIITKKYNKMEIYIPSHSLEFISYKKNTTNMQICTNTLFYTPGRSTWVSHPHSSWHRRCQTLHSSWEPRIRWRVASLRKTHNHLLPPQDRNNTVNTTYNETEARKWMVKFNCLNRSLLLIDMFGYKSYYTFTYLKQWTRLSCLFIVKWI